MSNEQDSEQSDDYHLRFQIATPEFSAEQDRQHAEAMESLRAALDAGRKWDGAIRAVKIPAGPFRELVLADFLKVLLAERHFQGGGRLKEIAREIGAPMELLVAMKEEMLREVSDSAQEAYRMTRQS
ncbi:hypothetical protein SIID45300_00799 [Candidatus Magnetaquicoccaceae bacterium FCR-1]|uniref:Uncharacterized protein n=1 Tax=Candidatus Magnetaquiglobus chichijimensis TaxID=3141448 RepID=A0ABQ0C6H7_9PROT